jgi:hypothetical protein
VQDEPKFLAVISQRFDYGDLSDDEPSPRQRTFNRIHRRATVFLNQCITERDHTSPIDQSGDYKIIHAWHERLYRKYCQPAAIALAQLFSAKGFEFFIVGLDECTQLNVAKTPGVRRLMSLGALQRIMKAADDCDSDLAGFTIWYTLLDTNSGIADLVPPRAVASSSRLAQAHSPLSLPGSTSDTINSRQGTSVEHLKKAIAWSD